MAKHAKKNNIISYDEAKQKKIQERLDRQNSSGRHSRNDYEDYDEFNNDSYFDDAKNDNGYIPKYASTNNKKPKYAASKTPKYGADSSPKYSKNPDEFIDDMPPQEYTEEDEAQRFERRNPRYKVNENRLPNNMVNFIIVAAMIIILIIISIKLYDFYAVETIVVEGNDEVKYHDITELCGVEYKQSMMTVHKDDIVESFESKLPMIEVVDVKKVWPNILEIYVKERQPVCYIVLKGSQKCALLGENNVCLSIEDSYLNGDMPRIYGLDVGTGELGKELIDGETRKLEVLKEIISAMNETGCIAELESININNTTNIIMMSTSGTTIKIGDTTNLIKKFETVKTGVRRLIIENNTNVTMIVPGDNTFYIE